MALCSSTFKHHSYLQSSLTLLLFFASWGVWWSFFQIWLTDPESGLGLNGAQVGTIYSANSLGTLVIMLFYGVIQDKLHIKRHLVIFASVIMTLIGPFAIWVYRPLLEDVFFVGVFAGAIVLSAGFMAAVGLLEAFSERLSRIYNYEYGQARMWGSVGYAVVALAAGFLFTVNPELNFWFGSAFGLLCLLVQICWKGQVMPGSTATNAAVTPSLREIVGGLYSPQMGAVILFVLLSWTFYTVFDQQMFPQFYTQLFDSPERGQQVYGVLNSIQVFLEAIMLGLVPILMRKAGVKTTLMLGMFVMFFRILGCAVFQDPVVISFIKLLHAPEVALCILPIFRYFTLHFNPALSATLYMVGFQVASQVGNIILSPVLGALRDDIGYQPTFYVIAGIVLVAGAYGMLILKRDDQHVEGDPFVRDSKGGSMIEKKA
ncbi:MFS transporter [Halomonas binhaiensis]|uniref:MFS transporter n=1 Tax=Halomonas binhaiensis TaxID=2562282 RepID=A0A5C1NDL6_9GAMM|nr:MFS transporter [Halomonas binhaiensis]QEM80763.1 MFS transporter [Halomonas binhaiensis]